MLDLEPLILALHLAQRLEFGRHGLVYIDTLGHDPSLACEPAPTRQHEGMDVKRGGHIGYCHAWKLAQANRSGLEGIAIAIDRPGTWFWHRKALLIVRSECPLNRRNYPLGSNELLGSLDQAQTCCLLIRKQQSS